MIYKFTNCVLNKDRVPIRMTNDTCIERDAAPVTHAVLLRLEIIRLFHVYFFEYANSLKYGSLLVLIVS